MPGSFIRPSNASGYLSLLLALDSIWYINQSMQTGGGREGRGGAGGAVVGRSEARFSIHLPRTRGVDPAQLAKRKTGH